MRKLGQTISALARHRRHWSTLLQSTAGQRRSAASSAGPSHLVELTGFGSNPGALRMFTHVPKKLEHAPALVVVLHGCTQSAADYDLGAGWSTLAERYGFVVLLPEQTAANNPKTCFNWFLPGDTARDRGEALSIRQMIEKTIGAHGIDRSKVFITGLSAGGAMSAAMLSVYPEVFAAGAIIAGLPYGSAGNVQEAFESMFQGRTFADREWGDKVRRATSQEGPWPRVSVWHGDRDATVKPINAESLIAQWSDLHGIETAPLEDAVDGYPRKVWRRDGVDVIESYTITGMAHGTPLDTGTHGGAAGPFLLDVGISSSYHIAKFFGLTGEARARARANEPVREEASHPLVPDDVEIIPAERVEILDAKTDGPKFGGKHEGGIDVMAIITRALTSAGLMKPGA